MKSISPVNSIYPTLLFVLFLVTSSLAQVGIGTTSPEATLHVVGDLKVETTNTTTPTKLSGIDAAGLMGDITLGTNLSLSGGILSATGGGDDHTKEKIVLINETFGIKNNWDLGLDGTNSDVTVFIIRKSGPGTELKIRGITGGTDGRRIRIINDSGVKIKFEEDKNEASTGNKIYIYTKLGDMTAYGSCELIYSTAISDDTGHWNIVQLDDN